MTDKVQRLTVGNIPNANRRLLVLSASTIRRLTELHLGLEEENPRRELRTYFERQSDEDLRVQLRLLGYARTAAYGVNFPTIYADKKPREEIIDELVAGYTIIRRSGQTRSQNSAGKNFQTY